MYNVNEVHVFLYDVIFLNRKGQENAILLYFEKPFKSAAISFNFIGTLKNGNLYRRLIDCLTDKTIDKNSWTDAWTDLLSFWLVRSTSHFYNQVHNNTPLIITTRESKHGIMCI